MDQRLKSRSNMRTTGRIISGIVVALMSLDGVTKLTKAPQVLQAMALIGYPAELTIPLGLLVLACTLVYAVPRTSVLGAILLTGFLGGATAAKTRLEDPTLFISLALGVMAWIGLYLRDERLHALIPLRAPHAVVRSDEDPQTYR